MGEGDQASVYTYGAWELDLGRRELRADGVSVPIGSRAFAILEVLVTAGGELVSSDDLMSAVWPGSMVAENTLQVHISSVRKALGPDRGLLRTASGRGYRLLGPWLIKATESSGIRIERNRAPVFSQAVSGNLPVASSDLIGRSGTVQHVRDLLSAYRIVTLTGAGGVGKTRLALEIVRSQLAEFEDGGWLVELASLSAPDMVPAAVVAVLGLDLGGDQANAASVARAIGERRLLLLLDNCEHVIEAAAALAESIMCGCPRVSVLATSRELLRVDGEYAYRVPSLDLPPLSPAAAQDVLEHSAVQLFIARMRGTDADFAPSAHDLLAIAAICRRLDGMPLAIEFAAARASVLGIEQLLSRLDDRFEVFTVGRRTALPRHQTLRATLDWSYELLPEIEQRLLRRVAVFSGGFTLDAATAVMSDTDGMAGLVVEGVANLVEKSLVALEPGTSSRWRMLETTRSYALEKLAEAGETEAVARMHATFFSGLFAPGMAASRVQPALERMAVYDNVRAALDWAFSAKGDTTIGVALTAACGPVWIHFSIMPESQERIEYALKAINPETDASGRLRMQLLFALGLTLLHKADSAERTRLVLSEALGIAERLADVDTQLQVLWALWIHFINGAEPAAAEPYGRLFQDVAQRSGDPANVLVSDRLMGNAMHYSGRQTEARRRFEHVLDHAAAHSAEQNLMWSAHDQYLLARARLARVLWLQGFVDQARRTAQESLEDAQSKDHTQAICFVHAEIVCPIALTTGDLATAERSVATLLELATRHGMIYWARFARCHEGALLIRRGDVANGSSLLRAALESFRSSRQMVHYLGFIGDFAEGLAAAGRPDEAHAIIDEALASHDGDGRLWCIAELRRVKGELLLQGAAVAAAETWFDSAMTVAAEHGALLWEMRAALSLARLRISENRRQDGRRVLRPVYDRFTEGLETADLRSARVLLS